MDNDRLITVAIHTYEHAIRLKNLLESEGVPAVLHNVNLSQPVVSSGVRIRIKESDLPQALRIIENTEIFTDLSATNKQVVLLPIDFNEHSTRAADLAFHLAHRHKATIALLNTYMEPYVAGTAQLDITPDYYRTDTEVKKSLERKSLRHMGVMRRSLRDRIKDGSLPPVKFTTEVAEGVPEEVINQWAKAKKPTLIVMGTRGAQRKESEMVGSVTAEVLDSCRSIVITIPENAPLTSLADIKHVAVLCSLDQEDILALDTLYRVFSQEQLHVTLIDVPQKKSWLETPRASQHLLDYCSQHYPRFTFDPAHISVNDPVSDYMAIQNARHIDMIMVPNKKKNIFARLFNPSLAHKLLFSADIPMMVVPV